MSFFFAVKIEDRRSCEYYNVKLALPLGAVIQKESDCVKMSDSKSG